jgi:hypothetical protein
MKKSFTSIDDIMHPGEVSRLERQLLDYQISCLDKMIQAIDRPRDPLAATKAVAFAEDAVHDSYFELSTTFLERSEVIAARDQVRRIAAAGIESKESQ